MARVAITEVFLRNSIPPTIRRELPVEVLKRGTAERATLFEAESGSNTVEQPLVTDSQGRPRAKGNYVYVTPGRYTFKAEGIEVPWEAAEGAAGGGGGGGAVESVNGKTGAVNLIYSDVGADASGAASAAQAASQPLDFDLTAIAALTTTAFGREFLSLATEAAGRAKLGLGTAATQASTAFATPAEVSTEKTRAETAEALKLAKASNLSDLGSAATARTNLGLGSAATTASTAYDAAGAASSAQAASQPLDSDLTAIAALATTEYGRSLLTAANLAGVIGTGVITEAMLATAVQTKLKGAVRIPSTFSMPVGAEVKAEQLGQFWQSLAAGETCKLVEMKYALASGTKAKFSVKQNGTAVTGFKEKEATTTPGTATGEVTVASGDLFALVVESIEGTPKGLSVSLVFESTH